VADAVESTSAGHADPAAGETATGRGSLDRQRIIDAAVRLIDQYGLRQLTMRRLGSHLGVEGMALYHYIPGRESLLDGVVETVVDNLHDDPDLKLVGSDWPDYLRRLALAVRRTAFAHPEVFPLIASRPTTTPWTRPPLRSLRWTETFLRAMTDCGLSGGTAIVIYRSWSGFLLGHLLLDLSVRDVAAAGQEHDQALPLPVPDVIEYPLLAGLDPALLRENSADFERDLELLLRRLAAEFGH
jgi:AcrR family transcriptional regulator